MNPEDDLNDLKGLSAAAGIPYIDNEPIYPKAALGWGGFATVSTFDYGDGRSDGPVRVRQKCHGVPPLPWEVPSLFLDFPPKASERDARPHRRPSAPLWKSLDLYIAFLFLHSALPCSVVLSRCLVVHM